MSDNMPQTQYIFVFVSIGIAETILEKSQQQWESQRENVWFSWVYFFEIWITYER